MKDLKDQLNRAEQYTGTNGEVPNKKNKTAIAVVIAICVVIIAFIVGIFVVINNFLGHVFDSSDSGNGISTYSYTAGSYNGYTGSYNNSVTTTGEQTTAAKEGSNYASGSTFQAGTVAGTTYQSSFSGIKFTAPSSWTLKAGNGSASNGVITDLTAQDGGNSNSVAIMYYPLSNSGSYNSASAVLSGLKASLSGVSVINNNVTLRIAGNSFTGFIYTAENNGTTIYSEVLGAEVNGYVMILNVNSLSSSDLTTVMNMFS